MGDESRDDLGLAVLLLNSVDLLEAPADRMADDLAWWRRALTHYGHPGLAAAQLAVTLLNLGRLARMRTFEATGTVRLTRGGKSAGSGSYITPTATSHTVSIKLSKSVARLIAQGKKVKVTVTITGTDLRAPLATFTATVTLKR